jgi:hypothetical protein
MTQNELARDETVVGQRGNCAECDAPLTYLRAHVDAECVMFCNEECIIAWCQRIGVIKAER